MPTLSMPKVLAIVTRLTQGSDKSRQQKPYHAEDHNPYRPIELRSRICNILSTITHKRITEPNFKFLNYSLWYFLLCDYRNNLVLELISLGKKV